MLMLLLALAEAPPAEGAKADFQGCEMTASGWVCYYKMPPVTLRSDPNAPAITLGPPPLIVQPVISETGQAEAARRARLIARCADAGWMSLCLPGERREARALRQQAEVAAALRSRVTGLLGEKKCDEAVKAALDGGDLALAGEARAFCKP